MGLLWDIFCHKTRRPRGDVLRSTKVYDLGRSFWIAYFKIFHGFKLRGQHNIPDHGPVIFAPNHTSYYDPPVAGMCVPYQIRYMAMEELFRWKPLASLILAHGAYPVKLKSADKGAVATTLKILKNKEALMIFPEGGRSASYDLMPFEQGLARLMLQVGGTIVPTSIVGVYEAWSRHEPLPLWFHPIIVKFHTPIIVPRIEDRGELKERIDDLNEQIARPIRRRIKAWLRLKQRLDVP
ncbi:MAG: 1-acyl-sn-glycerol-3-phosphate acyltransferase [Candidatus Sumerlaeaceae bacterium]|nr:1-acyl-sn-glycerol-3-phosphate acyltransferase [Candidatus Sumerlaeaceae bacterium]